MIYAPDTPAANRFPWRIFLSQTKLSKGPFKEILKDDGFLKTVADAYERKGAMLTDEGMYECVENVYFSMFKTMFVNEDVFWAGALEDGFLAPGDQPSIDGFVFDRFAKEVGQKKEKSFAALSGSSQKTFTAILTHGSRILKNTFANITINKKTDKEFYGRRNF